jgi:hypothetical protein
MPIVEAFAILTAEEIAAAEAAKIAAQIAAQEAATQAAIQVAQQEAARVAAEQASISAAESGITQIAQNAAPEIAQIAQNSTMTPAQQAYMQASNASTGQGIAQGTVPLQPAGTPIAQTASNTVPESLSRSLVSNTGGAAPNLNYAANSTSLTNAVSPAASYSPYSLSGSGATESLKMAGSEGIKGTAGSYLNSAPSALSKGWETATTWMGQHPNYTAAGAYLGANKLGLFDNKKQNFRDDKYDGPLSRYQMSSDFEGRQADPTEYQYTPRYASGGIMGAAPVEQMSNNAAMGANTMYPMSNTATSSFATPYQAPQSTNMLANMVAPSGGGAVGAMSGEPNMQGTRMAEGGQVPGYASGGFFKNVFGDAAQLVGDAGAGVGQFVNNLGQGRVSIGRPESDQTAEQIARKYYTNTAPAQNVNPQQYQYNQQYAEGGVTRYAKGNLTNSLDYYTDMLGGESGRQIAEASKPVGGKGDAGIARDTDPDTAYLSAAEAAAVRMGKVNAKANMQGLTLPRPKPINRINLKPQGVKQAEASSSLDPEMAAQGGIMHSSLGGYAAGGNPRLLRGPGDGMSDNIPATIAGKQPARLADGEFVIPADVVSHLGNGSTEAGAKKLHDMMNKIRKARTGNPKQGKQINPNKFLPK